MQVGAYADGRPLSFEHSTSQYDVGGTPITVEQLRAYDAHNQIAWLPGYGLTKAAAPTPSYASAPLDSPLSSTEYALYAVAFFFVPFVNVWVSSILYYVWRREQPMRAKQINQLGFMVFGSQILLYFVLAGCSALVSAR
jgi:hypothetical protein